MLLLCREAFMAGDSPSITVQRIATHTYLPTDLLMAVCCMQNLRRNDSSFTWHQPCHNQTAL